MAKGYYLNFLIKNKIHRFVFTTHALKQMETRKVNDQKVITLFKDIEDTVLQGLINNKKEIIISSEDLGFSMVLDFKKTEVEAEGKAIKLVTVIDKTEVFAKKGTELIYI